MTTYICGPQHDKREVLISLPKQASTVCVLVSGGIDSAILFYLINLENNKVGNIHTIVPMTVARKEGAKIFAHSIVKQIQMEMGLPLQPPYQVGNNTDVEYKQVSTGMSHAIRWGCDIVYLGVIDQRPEHLMNWQKIRVMDSLLFKYPFAKVEKSHVIDLVNQVGMTSLFYLSHSCDTEIDRCGSCNGCRERSWGFSQLGMIDPGQV